MHGDVDYFLQSPAGDNSGLTINVGNGKSMIVTRGGVGLNPPQNPGTSGSAAAAVDTNGNQITSNSSGVFTDTLGATALTISGSVPNPVTFTYTDSNGQAQTVTLTYKQYTIQTHFNCPNIQDFGVNQTITDYLVDNIQYPDQSKYIFKYEPTPGNSADTTGRIASVQLPTGGTISYNYAADTYNGIECGDGSTSGFTRVTPDSATGTAYARSNVGTNEWTTLVTDATTARNQTLMWFQQNGNNFYETRRRTYSGSAPTPPQVGTPLRTIDTCYNTAAPDCTATALTLPITEQGVYTTLDNGQQSRVKTTFDQTFSLMQERDEYDYGASSPTRKTILTYAPNEPPDRVAGVQITDGNGVQQALTNYYYDQSGSISPTSGVPQHSGGGVGNVTEISQWLNTTNTYLNTFLTYEDTGNVLTSKDPNGNTTQFAYANSDAYVSQVTLPQTGSVQHIVKSTYDSNTGLVTDTYGQNNEHTHFIYDSMLRPTEVDYPDGGKTKTIYTPYNSTTQAAATLETQQYMTSSNYIDSFVYLDGLGRTSKTQLNDPEGNDLVNTTYDAMGRLLAITNPYRSTSDPTYGITCNGTMSGGVCSSGYDALGRLTVVTDPDGNTSGVSYSGPCVTASDETGRQRQLCSDGLGRLTQVTEPNPTSGSLSTGAYPTTYTYDLLDNLKTVTQTGDGSGTRTRSFTYDSLSRMLSASNPESGLICYGTRNAGPPASCNNGGYDGDGNLIYFTDARGTKTTYSYDTLSRPTQKSYSDGVTASNWYAYDEASIWGVSPQNPIGRLTHTTGSGSVANNVFSYDAMGRIVEEWPCAPSSCGTRSYPFTVGYDLVGDMTSLTYPSGRNITLSYSGAGRL